jgi:hypothetical protein
MEDVVDGSTFDKLARLAATSPARRSLLRSGLAAAIAGFGAAALSGADDAEAKSCEKKCQDKKDCNDKKDNGAKQKCKQKCKKKCACKPKQPEEACSKSSECCPDETKYTCALSHNSGLNTVCCGTQGAACTSTFQCCQGFVCASGQCVTM